MKIKPGYLYHIKDEFFEVVDDDKLMKNKPNGGGRPTLICKVEGSEFLWAIPISSQTDKYIKLLKQKREKFKNPLNVVIGIYNYKEAAFLLQNMYPINEQYIDHIHKIGSDAVCLHENLYKEITNKVKRILNITKKLEIAEKNNKVTQTNISYMMTVVEPRPYSEHINEKYVAAKKAQEKEQARKKQEFKKEVEKNKSYKIKVAAVEHD